MFLAVENSTKLIVNIKQFPINNILKINQELSVYREMEAYNV